MVARYPSAQIYYTRKTLSAELPINPKKMPEKKGGGETKEIAKNSPISKQTLPAMFYKGTYYRIFKRKCGLYARIEKMHRKMFDPIVLRKKKKKENKNLRQEEAKING